MSINIPERDSRPKYFNITSLLQNWAGVGLSRVITYNLFKVSKSLPFSNTGKFMFLEKNTKRKNIISTNVDERQSLAEY